MHITCIQCTCTSKQAINDTLEGTGSPVQVVSGYLGRVTISVPWSALMSDSCKVEVAGLTLSVMPCFSSSLGEDLSKKYITLCMYVCMCIYLLAMVHVFELVFMFFSNDD